MEFLTPVSIKKKNVVFDATLLSSLMGCGRYTDIRFNHSLVPMSGKSNSLEIGSIVHKYLEYYYGSLIKGFTKSQSHQSGMAAAETYIRGCPTCIDPTCNLCKGQSDSDKALCPQCNGTGIYQECKHQKNEFEGVKNTPRDSEGYHTGWSWALDSCEQYYAFYANDFWVPLEVEVVKSKLIYEDDEIRVLWKAKLDLVVDTTQAILSVDHKTMKQNRDTISTNNQFMGQCIIMDSRNAIINKFGLQKSLKPAEKFGRVLMSYSGDRLLEWQSEIVPYYAYQYIGFVESGYWPPNFDHCETKFGKCQYLDICTADRGMREEILRVNFSKAPEWNPTNEVPSE
jgi:hypothetical protein